MAAGRPWEGDRGTTEMYFEAEINGDDQSLTQRDWDDAHLINAALDIHADDPAFGYRFIADDLPARGVHHLLEERWSRTPQQGRQVGDIVIVSTSIAPPGPEHRPPIHQVHRR